MYNCTSVHMYMYKCTHVTKTHIYIETCIKNEKMNYWINERMKYWINESMNYWINEMINYWMNESVNYWIINNDGRMKERTIEWMNFVEERKD